MRRCRLRGGRWVQGRGRGRWVLGAVGCIGSILGGHLGGVVMEGHIWGGFLGNI